MSLRNQNISLPHLEELEIHGIKGEDHELEFLKLLIRCAPMLTSVRLSEMFTPTDDACQKIYDISKAYSLVKCYVYPTTDYHAIVIFWLKDEELQI
jgi:hypothetical protein